MQLLLSQKEPRRKASMEESEETKLAGENDLAVDVKEGAGHRNPPPHFNLQSKKHLRSLLAPFEKDQLVDLLVQTSTKIPEAAEEIRGMASSHPAHRKLFVYGLDQKTTSETLSAAFSAHGEIEEGTAVINKITGNCRGFGFITFKNMESAQKALKEPSRLIDGRLSICRLSRVGFGAGSNSADARFRKLYVEGLSRDTSTEAFLGFFAKYGEIEEGSVVYDKETSKSRGFGFVTFKNAGDAMKVITDLDNKMLEGRRIAVKHAFPKKKGDIIQTPWMFNSPYLSQSQDPSPFFRGNEPYGMPFGSPTSTERSAGYPYYLTN